MVNNSESVERKDQTILTPKFVTDKIYTDLKRLHIHNILDIGCNTGNLSKPFRRKRSVKIIGNDIVEDYRNNFDNYICEDFLQTTKKDFENMNIDFIMSNPPFQRHPTLKELYPTLILEHIFKLFGKTIPVVMIVPNYFLTNSKDRIDKINSKWNITKVIQLHKTAFIDYDIHIESAILYFNIKTKKSWEVLAKEKKVEKKRVFKSITFSAEEKKWLDKNIKNFNLEMKLLIKDRYPSFPYGAEVQEVVNNYEDNEEARDDFYNCDNL